MKHLWFLLLVLFLIPAPIFATFEHAKELKDKKEIPELNADTLRIIVGDLGTNFIYVCRGEAIEVRFDKQQKHDEPFEVRWIPPSEIEQRVNRFGRHWYTMGFEDMLLKDISLRTDPRLEAFIKSNFQNAREALKEWTPIVQIHPDDLMEMWGVPMRVKLSPKTIAGKICFGLWGLTFGFGVAMLGLGGPFLGLKFLGEFLKHIHAPMSWRDPIVGIGIGHLAIFGVAMWMHWKSAKAKRNFKINLGRGNDMAKLIRYYFGYSTLLFGGTGLYMACAAGLRSLGIFIP